MPEELLDEELLDEDELLEEDELLLDEELDEDELLEEPLLEEELPGVGSAPQAVNKIIPANNIHLWRARDGGILVHMVSIKSLRY
jgi:hypothetical protein